MTARLALRNVRRNVPDYAVYFVTLVLGIMLYYIFLAVPDQQGVVLAEEDKNSLLWLLQYGEQGIRAVAAVILAALVVYANRFLMRRRKREFGIYMLLGMGRGQIAGILVMETALIGVVSLILGLVLGILLSQSISVLIGNVLAQDMEQFHFAVSGRAAGRTLVFFFVLYMMAFVVDLFAVGRRSLAELLVSGRRGEKNVLRSPAVCLPVFVLAVCLLGHTYYSVSVGIDRLVTPGRIVLQAGKLAAGNLLLFWSLSGVLLLFCRCRRKFYLRGLVMFTTEEITARINTNVAAGSLICFLMFMAISVSVSALSISGSLNGWLESLLPVDVTFDYWPEDGPETLSGLLREQGISPERLFRDYAEVPMYLYNRAEESEGTGVSRDEVNVFANYGMIVRQSDYNRLAGLYGKEELRLAGEEYAVVSNHLFSKAYYDRTYLKTGHVIKLAGREYHPESPVCRDGFMRLSYLPENIGFTVVPDEAVFDREGHMREGFCLERNFIAADYRAVSEWDAGQTERYLRGETFYGQLFPGKAKEDYGLSATFRTDISRKGRGVLVMLGFLGLYIGLMSFIAGAALFALKELSQTVSGAHRYKLLRAVGVDRKMLHRSLLWQNGIFFGVPLIVALIHTAFCVRPVLLLILAMIEDLYQPTELIRTVILATGGLTAVYVMYFVAAYRVGRRIVDGDSAVCAGAFLKRRGGRR